MTWCNICLVQPPTMRSSDEGVSWVLISMGLMWAKHGTTLLLSFAPLVLYKHVDKSVVTLYNICSVSWLHHFAIKLCFILMTVRWVLVGFTQRKGIVPLETLTSVKFSSREAAQWRLQFVVCCFWKEILLLIGGSAANYTQLPSKEAGWWHKTLKLRKPQQT